jgi:AraC family transcriptional regulator
MPLDNSGTSFPSPVVLSGKIPTPLLSTVPRGWSGIQLQIYPGWEGEIVTAHPFHVVSLQLVGTMNLLQRRDGRSLHQIRRAGSIIITPVGEPKEWCNGKKERCEVLALNLLPWLFDQALDTSSDDKRPAGELIDNFGTRDVQIEFLAKKLLAESQSMDLASGMYVEALTRELTIHLLRHHSTAKTCQSRAPRKLSPREIQRVTDYVSEHLHEDLSVRDLAATIFMSPSHFAHVFKLTTLLAPHRFVLERRIERAKTMLRESRLSVAEVAQRVGFSTHAHFSVAFHRMTCRTPIQYRNEA